MHQSTSDSIEIQLARGYVTVIDAIDGDLANLSWSIRLERAPRVYVQRRQWIAPKRYRSVPLHRVILERMLGRPLETKELTDHIDGNPLNNRRENLRVCTSALSAQNRGMFKTNRVGLKGVTKVSNGKFRAQIQVNHKKMVLGHFDTPEEAHAAYCEAAIKYFGEYARFD